MRIRYIATLTLFLLLSCNSSRACFDLSSGEGFSLEEKIRAHDSFRDPDYLRQQAILQSMLADLMNSGSASDAALALTVSKPWYCEEPKIVDRDALFEHAMNLAGNQAGPLLLLANACFEDPGSRPAGCDDSNVFQRLLAADPDNAWPYLAMAVRSKQAGDNDRMNAWMEQAAGAGYHRDPTLHLASVLPRLMDAGTFQSQPSLYEQMLRDSLEFIDDPENEVWMNSELAEIVHYDSAHVDRSYLTFMVWAKEMPAYEIISSISEYCSPAPRMDIQGCTPESEDTQSEIPEHKMDRCESIARLIGQPPQLLISESISNVILERIGLEEQQDADPLPVLEYSTYNNPAHSLQAMLEAHIWLAEIAEHGESEANRRQRERILGKIAD